jgi:hypothetical protein
VTDAILPTTKAVTEKEEAKLPPAFLSVKIHNNVASEWLENVTLTVHSLGGRVSPL